MKFISTVKFYCISGPQDLRPRRRSRQPGRRSPYLRLPQGSREAATRLFGCREGASRVQPACSHARPVRAPSPAQVSLQEASDSRGLSCGSTCEGVHMWEQNREQKKKQTCSQTRSSTSPFFVSADLKSVLPGTGKPCGARVLACFLVSSSQTPAPSSLPFVP